MRFYFREIDSVEPGNLPLNGCSSALPLEGRQCQDATGPGHFIAEVPGSEMQ
jgi:hypothetical protein